MGRYPGRARLLWPKRPHGRIWLYRRRVRLYAKIGQSPDQPAFTRLYRSLETLTATNKVTGVCGKPHDMVRLQRRRPAATALRPTRRQWSRFLQPTFLQKLWPRCLDTILRL